MAVALVGPILNALTPLLTQEVQGILGVEEELPKLKDTLSTILAVLEDAERRQFKEKAVRDWLEKLKDAAYDAQDILDKCAIRGLRVQQSGGSQRRNSSWVSRKILPCFRYLHVIPRRKMARKIKRFQARLDAIDSDKKKFHLIAGVMSDRQIESDDRIHTISSLSEPQVYGRENDVNNVVNLFLSSAANNITIIPIVGMGGLGKTTVAQVVYNDARMESHFEMRMWVCVAEDFKLKRLVKAILESACTKVSDLTELDPLQRSLRGTLEGKRFLLVLDDVWSDDEIVWEPLKQILMCDAQGSAVIVTTRMEKVALRVTTLQNPYRLEILDDVHCGALFEWKAFGGGRREKKQSLVEIGIEIVHKCKGIPLAAKALGSLLYFKNEEREWLLIRDSEIWELPGDENKILPILRLSYDHLPPEMKQCFAYCSIFPKDSIIDKKRLTRLWIANGFICSRGNMELEDVGHQIFNEMIWRTLFQDVKCDDLGSIISCKMHDLVHDLARSITLDECLIMGKGKKQIASNRTRHLFSYNYDKLEDITKCLLEVKKVRTAMLDSPEHRSIGGIKYIQDFKQLRVLDLSNVIDEKLPHSVAELKHLRYLDISRWRMKTLPEAITNLQFLQSFILKDCSRLYNFPHGLPNMTSLRHLDITGCVSLEHLPSNIGKLSLLQTLPIFIVGAERGLGLSQLAHLNLRGELAIKHLERVRSGSPDNNTKLISGQILDSLKLSWRMSSSSSGDQENSEQLLESLQPHAYLKCLEIDGYGGTNLPQWLKQVPMLPNLVSLSLTQCNVCKILPALGHLSLLKQLNILQMDALSRIGSEFYGDTSMAFPSLEKLIIGSMPKLDVWSVKSGIQAFNHLLTLTIIKLPKLVNIPQGLLRSCFHLQYLVLHGCSFTTLEAELDNLVAMKRLQITDCEELIHLPQGFRSLSSLQELEITKCRSLKCLPSEDVLLGLTSLRTLSIKSCQQLNILTDNMRNLTALNYLGIWDCPNMVSLPEGMESLQSLRSLDIRGCEKLSCLPAEVVTTLESLRVSCSLILAASPEWVQKLTTLQDLFLYNCGSVLPALPPWLQQLTSLKRLHIYGASPELERRCKQGVGEDWHKIAHVPNILVA